MRRVSIRTALTIAVCLTAVTASDGGGQHAVAQDPVSARAPYDRGVRIFRTLRNWQPNTALLTCEWTDPASYMRSSLGMPSQCTDNAPLIEHAFNNSINRFRMVGIRGPHSLGPVEGRQLFNFGGPADYLLLSNLTKKKALTSFCRGNTPAAQARSRILVNVPVQVNIPAHLRMMVASHELTHAIQHSRSYKNATQLVPDYCNFRSNFKSYTTDRWNMRYVPFDDGWASEGLADYIAYTFMRQEYPAKRRLTFGAKAWESSYGLKEYDKGFFGPGWGPNVTPGYRASSFWRHLDMRYGLSPRSILRAVYFWPHEGHPPSAMADAADRLEEAVKSLTARSAARVLASFYTDFASWPEDYSIVSNSIAPFTFRKVAYDGCEEVRIAPGRPEVILALKDMVPYSARCLRLRIEPPQGGGTANTYQIGVEAAGGDKHVVDGLHLGRSVVQTGGIRTRNGSTTWSCGEHLKTTKRAPVTGDDCVINRAGGYTMTGVDGLREPYRVRWKLPPRERHPSGNSEVLVLTYAPVDEKGRITDHFRRLEEPAPPSVLLRIGVHTTVIEAPRARPDPGGNGENNSDGDKKEGSDRQDRPRDDAAPEPPHDGGPRMRIARIAPISAQGNPATLAPILFADDPRAEMSSYENWVMWTKMAARLKNTRPYHLAENSDISYEGYKRLMRQVHVSQYGFYEALNTDDVDRLDHLRETTGYIEGFSTDILSIPADDVVTVSVPRTVQRFDWEFSGTNQFRTWDDLQVGAISEALINPLYRLKPPGEDFTGGRRWGRGTVRVMDRTDETMTIRFEGRVCRRDDTFEEDKELKCHSWQNLFAEATFAFADTLRRRHRRKRWWGIIQRGYDSDLRVRLGGLRRIDDGLAEADASSEAGSTGSGGVAAFETCGCGAFSTLAARIDGAMPSQSQLNELDRCCAEWLNCRDDGSSAQADLLAICRM